MKFFEWQKLYWGELEHLGFKILCQHKGTKCIKITREVWILLGRIERIRGRLQLEAKAMSQAINFFEDKEKL